MLLGKTLQSSTLKMAIRLCVQRCDICGFGLLYWSTITYQSEKLDRDIGEEHKILIRTYARSGRDGIIDS